MTGQLRGRCRVLSEELNVIDKTSRSSGVGCHGEILRAEALPKCILSVCDVDLTQGHAEREDAALICDDVEHAVTSRESGYRRCGGSLQRLAADFVEGSARQQNGRQVAIAKLFMKQVDGSKALMDGKVPPIAFDQIMRLRRLKQTDLALPAEDVIRQAECGEVQIRNYPLVAVLTNRPKAVPNPHALKFPPARWGGSETGTPPSRHSPARRR